MCLGKLLLLQGASLGKTLIQVISTPIEHLVGKYSVQFGDYWVDELMNGQKYK